MRNFAKSPLLAKRLFLITFIFFCVSCVCTIAWPFVDKIYTSIFSQNWCEKYALGDNISCGEESLLRSESLNNTNYEFEEAFASWKKGKFKEAVDFFDKHRKQNKNKNKNDGEALIYLNNAKLMAARRKGYTIAVIVPANIGISEAMLRGAAQVQDDFNNDPKNPGLKIIIVNDSNDNDPGNAKQLINKLLSKQDIIAVIGHYASDVVKQALPVYQQRKVVLISAVSATRQYILADRKYPDNFLFKTNTDVTHQMKTLVDALKTLGINIPQDKVAIFYNDKSTFSQSAFEYLKSKFGQNADNKIIEKQISSLPKVDNELNDVKQQGAKALILIPDGQIANKGKTSDSFKNAKDLIRANKDQLPVVGQTVLYNLDILKSLADTKYIDKFRIIITWSPLTTPNKNLIERAKSLWGTSDIGVQAGWYYDATVVLTKALTNALKDQSFMNDSVEKQRLAIQNQLKSDSFQVTETEGASGTISFDQDRDRKEDTSQIFKVGLVPTDCRTEGAMFLPADYDYQKSGCPNKTQK